MNRRRLIRIVGAVVSVALVGCLNETPAGNIMAVKVPDEHVPEDVDIVSSDDERINDVSLIQEILDMLEEGNYGRRWGSEDFPEVDYVLQRGNEIDSFEEGEYPRRFEEARDALEQLPRHEGQPNQAPRGPNPSGRYISHANFVAAFKYSVEE